MLTPTQRGQLLELLAVDARDCLPQVLQAVERAATARVYGCVKLPLYGSAAAGTAQGIGDVMRAWEKSRRTGSTRQYQIRTGPNKTQWEIVYEIAQLDPVESRRLDSEQETRLKAISPGISLDSVRRVLEATGPVDVLLMDFMIDDSTEWLIQRIAMTLFVAHLEAWSIRSCTPGRQAYSWRFNGNEYEIYQDRAQRQWRIRIKERHTYEQIVELAPLDLLKDPGTVFSKEQRLAMQKILMLGTTYVTERDMPITDMIFRRNRGARVRVIQALSSAMQTAKRAVRTGRVEHHQDDCVVIAAEDVLDDCGVLFHDLAAVIERGEPKKWIKTDEAYAWTNSDGITFTFYLHNTYWSLKLDMGDPPSTHMAGLFRDLAASFHARLSALESGHRHFPGCA